MKHYYYKIYLNDRLLKEVKYDKFQELYEDDAKTEITSYKSIKAEDCIYRTGFNYSNATIGDKDYRVVVKIEILNASEEKEYSDSIEFVINDLSGKKSGFLFNENCFVDFVYDFEFKN